jgi:hypothetical protein
LTTGPYSTSSIDGECAKSVAIGVGYQNKARAAKGNWIVLAERDDDYNIVAIKSAQVGVTKGVKADTWYVLQDGKFKVAA